MTEDPKASPGWERRTRRWRQLAGIALLIALVLGIRALLTTGSIGYPVSAGADPLLSLGPETFDRRSGADAVEVARLDASLDRLLDHIEETGTFRATEIDQIPADARRRAVALFTVFLDHFVALDRIKSDYRAWPGISYLQHRARHARAFGIAYSALLCQCRYALRLIELTQSNPLFEALLDEPLPSFGLGSGAYARMKFAVLHVRTYSMVAAGKEWFDLWMRGTLEADPLGQALVPVIDARFLQVGDTLRRRGVSLLAANAEDVVRDQAFEAWYPVQSRVAEVMGDTRVIRSPDEGLITLEDIATVAIPALRPGDICVERRNWFLSNIGLPGFWPHAALYVGTPEELSRALDADPAVRARFPGDSSFTGHLRETYPQAWAAYAGADPSGHPMRILEAVSEGVIFSSIEHSARADYFAAVRPRLSLLEVALALDAAFRLFGRPYDFNFDFRTDAELVCSELVYKAYQPEEGRAGLHFDLEEVMGRRVLTPTEIIRKLDREADDPAGELSFVLFLDGREGLGRALAADQGTLRGTPQRPKWDILQP